MRTGLKSAVNASAVAVVIGIQWLLSSYRDSGYGGPHHDEVIALMAAKSWERRYVATVEVRRPPFNQVAAAEEWHAWVRGFTPVPFDEVASDVMTWDKHPPLAFWVLNRWLSLFRRGEYQHAVILTWLQMLMAGVLLGLLAARVTRSAGWGVMATTLFLFGNSAVFTGIWVRQYALFTVLYVVGMFLAGELARKGVGLGRFVIMSMAIAAICTLGMMTQYTFATMSGPIHAALLGVWLRRRDWRRSAILAGAYAAAAAAFLAVLPNALSHARTVSSDMSGQSQWMAAFGGVPQAVIPWPSAIPASLAVASGGIVLLGATWLGLRAIRPSEPEVASDRTPLAVIASGLLGAGALQMLLVGGGYYPGWATGPNHMCAFWLLTVLLLTDWLASQPRRLGVAVTTLLLSGMLGMQGLYAWHCHRILPRLNTSYIASTHPDLVLVDNLARGFVLQLTEVMDPQQPVLVADSQTLVDRLQAGNLTSYQRILYLPMDETARVGHVDIRAAAQQAAFETTSLPVVHTGLFGAILFEKRESPANSAAITSDVNP